jgi:hypothetical protein
MMKTHSAQVNCNESMFRLIRCSILERRHLPELRSTEHADCLAKQWEAMASANGEMRALGGLGRS